MNPIAQELFEAGDRYLMERPDDIVAMRTRMGTRGQNMTVQIYAFSALSSSVDAMYLLQEAVAKDEYDFDTVVKFAVDWLSTLAPPADDSQTHAIIGHRASIHYRLDNLADLVSRASAAIKRASTRDEVRELLQALEHYLNQVRTWIDLEFPWHELAVRYAEIMGDPVPRPAP